jgi:hypothetical protein
MKYHNWASKIGPEISQRWECKKSDEFTKDLVKYFDGTVCYKNKFEEKRGIFSTIICTALVDLFSTLKANEVSKKYDCNFIKVVLDISKTSSICSVFSVVPFLP